MSIAGGVGSRKYGESYGPAYQLPDVTSYCETCAAISKIMWDYRMLPATGEAIYARDMERTLYNAVLVGVSLNGTEYFYRNRMEVNMPEESSQKDESYYDSALRKGWFGCSCCPPTVHRLLASLQQYLYTVDDSGLQVHL